MELNEEEKNGVMPGFTFPAFAVLGGPIVVFVVLLVAILIDRFK